MQAHRDLFLNLPNNRNQILISNRDQFLSNKQRRPLEIQKNSNERTYHFNENSTNYQNYNEHFEYYTAKGQNHQLNSFNEYGNNS